jgi:uncharacterized membrane protein
VTLKVRLKDELIIIDIVTVLLALVIAFLPVGVLQAILGVPVALFFPGYTLLAALFPRKDDLSPLERLALSLGLSIVLVGFIGLILNYSPCGIRLYPVLISNTVFIIATSLVASFRRWRMLPEERFRVSLGFIVTGWNAMSRLYKGLTIALILAMLGSMGTLGYVMSVKEVGERFTQFYILSEEGNIEKYPEKLVVGEEARLILGVINQEREEMSYRVEVSGDGIASQEIGWLVLAYEEKWEREISFVPTRAGENQKVNFYLYKQGESEPYRELYLWVDVWER